MRGIEYKKTPTYAALRKIWAETCREQKTLAGKQDVGCKNRQAIAYAETRPRRNPGRLINNEKHKNWKEKSSLDEPKKRG